MAACLIALGSNLGDRAAHLRRAVDEVARLPQTRLVARSAWHETRPVGGPAGQGAFLNGTVLTATALAPAMMLAELERIESLTGRARTIRWDARTLDLDVLLYDGLNDKSPEIEIPHPRMHFRRFVLAPAVEVAPAMIHPPSGWTLARLLDQLDQGDNVAVVAAADRQQAATLAAQIVGAFGASGIDSPPVVVWSAQDWLGSGRRPKLLLAVDGAASWDERQARRMLTLPATGPVAWLAPKPPDALLREALATTASVWPELASCNPG